MSRTGTLNSKKSNAAIASRSKKSVSSSRKESNSTNSKDALPKKRKEEPKKDEISKENSKPIISKKTEITTTNNKKLEPTKSVRNNAATNKPATVIRQSSRLAAAKKTHPETPPSKRVTNTKFFPTKQMYSNALKRENLKVEEKSVVSPSTSTTSIRASKEPSTKNNKVITKTKKEQPPLKVLVAANSLNSDLSEIDTQNGRPRTATLKRGSIVNSNIAGPDIPLSETPSLASLASLEFNQDSSNEYEDDFDSYKSDFENYESSTSNSSSISSAPPSIEDDDDNSTDSSDISLSAPKASSSAGTTDEERMLDSGNYDLPGELKHRQLLDNIKESHIEHQQQQSEKKPSSSSTLASLSDEGFEDGGNGSKTSFSQQQQFVNFAAAQKKWKRAKNVQKQKRRGEQILSMIHLDTFNATLLDMPSVSYVDFIRIYGRSNAMQVATQTGDDDLDEEVQTDRVDITEKWTQFPVAYSEKKILHDELDENAMKLYRQEFLGVGGPLKESVGDYESDVKTNWNRLKKFLVSVEPIITVILNESQRYGDESEIKTSRGLPFSAGYIEFDTSSEILKDRPIVFVTFCSTTRVRFLTVHARKKVNTTEQSEIKDADSANSVVCIWNLSNIMSPEASFVVTGQVECCCFVAKSGELIVGGLEDGSITIWDKNKLKGRDSRTLHKPSFLTEIDEGHSCKVISIHSLMEQTNETLDWQQYKDKICSLDEDGTLILWSLANKSDVNLGRSQIFLIKTSLWSPQNYNVELTDLQCFDTIVSRINPNHVFISTNYGYILHCLLSGGKVNPKRYNPGKTAQSNCLECCPFSSLYFLAGYEDGSVILYSCLLERPLKVLKNRDDDSENLTQRGIHLVQWSLQRPCVFYAKDKSDTLHIWDLTISDLYPTHSVPLNEKITCMKLSPVFAKHSESSYLIFTTETGRIKLHILNAEYAPSNLTQSHHDVKTFLNYINRLCYV